MLESSKALYSLLTVTYNQVICYKILTWFIILLKLLLEKQIKRLARLVKSHTSTFEESETYHHTDLWEQ